MYIFLSVIVLAKLMQNCKIKANLHYNYGLCKMSENNFKEITSKDKMHYIGHSTVYYLCML